MFTLFATKDYLDQLAYHASTAEGTEASSNDDELGSDKWAYDAYPLGLAVAVFFCSHARSAFSSALETLDYLYQGDEVSKPE